jgi:7-cyano-7-deazaguanine reductase
MATDALETSPLGKRTGYIDQYCPDLLFPLPRQGKRDEIGVPTPLPFFGADLWTAFELSWLNSRGKPQVALADIIVPCTSLCLIESKSLKLYLNSMNGTSFTDWDTLAAVLRRDLSRAAEAPVDVQLHAVDRPARVTHFDGTCLDDLDVDCSVYTPHPAYLVTRAGHTQQTLFSNLLKSNCLVTGQPDWGSVQITYTGRPIELEGLLRYIVSFRNHNEFHEQCVERIFMDISTRCLPEALSVYARYTRRGGLDINPYRSTTPGLPPHERLVRQ